MKRWAVLSALVAVAAAPAGNRQAAYDAAQAAYDKGDWATAAAGFAPLLPNDPARPLNASGAVIAVRLAVALDQTGEGKAAAAMARRGIAGVPESDAMTLAEGWQVIGDQAHFALDVPAATDAYDKALRYAVASGYAAERIAAASGLGATLATVDPVRASAPLDALLDDKALVANLAKPTLAELAEVRARIALNAGDLPTARHWIDRALQATGGLGDRVDQLQIAIRGDAAIIAQRRHDADEARKYLTYTGAGHLKSVDWITQFSGDLPVCGTDGDLRPDDSAVVQLAIDADGHVVSAAPIYASRPGEVGIAFARATQSWHWNPESLTKVDAFWRASLRLEMRCDTRPDPEALGKPIMAEALRWWRAHGRVGSDSPMFVADGEPGKGKDDPAAVPILLAGTGASAEPTPLSRRLFDAADAPPAFPAAVIFERAETAAAQATTFREAARRRAKTLAAAVPGFAARYPDTLALAWLRVEWATALERSGDFGSALPLLGQVLATPETVLGHDDAIRQVAVLHIAIVRTRMGDASGAQADLKAAGLDTAQCSLVDTRPVPLNLSVVSSQFPIEAMRWRFEGFARIAYDIGPDGHIAGARTVLAYPPFVFGPGTEVAAQRFRYASPTLDGKVVGCQGERQTVHYRIPG